MKFPLLIALAAALSVTACTTPVTTKQKYLSRIEASSQLRLGMSPAQVRVILGQPDDVLDQVSVKGKIELWAYVSRIAKLNRIEGRGVLVAFRNGKVAAVTRR